MNTKFRDIKDNISLVKYGDVGGDAVTTNITGINGADKIFNIISLTQAEYDAISSPDENTLYFITQ